MNVLLIATTTGYQIRSFGEAADALGVRLVFASDRCDHLDDPWRDHAIPVRFHDPDLSTKQIVDAFGRSAPDGIVAVGDRPAILAAHAAAAFGLVGNAPDATVRSRNKLAAREAFRSVGLLTPWFRQVTSDADPARLAAECEYPVVIKPLALSGSRGVIRADDPHEFVAAFDRVHRLLQSADIRLERDDVHESVLIESFIPGREFAVEGILTHGKFTPLAIFDKPDPLDGPFFEETIYVTPSRASPDVQSAIIDTVAEAARALGLSHGPIHAECRVNAEGVYILEVAARPIGGLCSKALRFSCDGQPLSLEGVLLWHAVGARVDDVHRVDRASGVMMIPIPAAGVFKRTDGIEAARRVPLIEDVRITAKPDTRLTPLPEGRSYLGFIFAEGDAPGDVEEALREAHRHLHFTIDRVVPLLDA